MSKEAHRLVFLGLAALERIISQIRFRDQASRREVLKLLEANKRGEAKAVPNGPGVNIIYVPSTVQWVTF